MAPTPQNSSESPCLNSSETASSVSMTASSKIQKSSSSTSSCISNSNSSLLSNSNNSDSKTKSDVKTYKTEWPNRQGSLLPITCRGLFYDDSFFQDARKNFDDAMKEVLDQWGQRSHQQDDFTNYRKLREEDLQESNQAVSVTQDDTNHKVVLDVRDFMKGNVQVKVIDENEIVVEGSVEKQEGSSVSKKSFRRSFTFPGLVKSEAVSSAMSSDGVLTVTVPKNNQRQISSKMEDNVATNVHKSFKSLNVDRTQKDSNQSDINKNNLNLDNSLLKEIESDFLLPVTKRGLFFQDSFFESSRQDFEKSVEEVLKKWGESDSMQQDNMTTYRSLREQNLKEENQAISVTEEEDHHRVVLDVKDFVNGELKVKIVDENELKVEGNVNKETDGTTSNKTFYRSFTFPGLIKNDEVSSALSSDGILTVKVPKDNSNSPNASKQSIKLEEAKQINSKQTSERISSTKEKTHESQLNNLLEHSFPETSSLPVCEKGLFFQDDFFASARQDFENAVQEVLNKWGETTSSTDNMISYRNLRDRDLKDENQAVSTSEDHQCHKVVMDVRDFMNNELQVKVVDENELVVEGKVEKKDGSSTSKKNFHRRFVFPGLVKSEAVSSAMSSDGVLTITIPKQTQKEQNSKTVHFANNENLNTSKNSHKHANCDSTQNDVLQTSQQNITKSSQFGDFSSINDVFETETGDSWQNDFFATAHKHFEDATRNVFNHIDTSTSITDELNSFKMLQKDDCDGVQEATITEDHDTYKVVIRVGEFMGGKLQVNLLTHNQLMVEGRLEKEDETGKTSSKSFSRRFQLPGVVQEDAVTSALWNGVLTITAPKDPNKTTQNKISLHNHTSDKDISSNSHHQHSQQYSKETCGSRTSTFSHSSESQHFTSSAF